MDTDIHVDGYPPQPVARGAAENAERTRFNELYRFSPRPPRLRVKPYYQTPNLRPHRFPISRFPQFPDFPNPTFPNFPNSSSPDSTRSTPTSPTPSVARFGPVGSPRSTYRVGRPLRGRPLEHEVEPNDWPRTECPAHRRAPLPFLLRPNPSRCAPASCICSERSSPQPLRRRKISVHQRLKLRLSEIPPPPSRFPIFHFP